ncbi:MAG: hypothetical protein HYV29_09720 [Ignavibacteriales bacterium]|nr:hypothetical protein [Ignavibacteriales bacterium]
MTADMYKQINIRFLLLFIPVAYGSYLFHEFGHWSIGEMLGNRMAYSLNYVSPKSGNYIHDSHGLYVSIGGPAFSILQAMFALLIIEKFKQLYAYPFAFFPAFNRIFSLLFGGFTKQDEARISDLLGIGHYLIAIVVVVILLLIVVRCSHTLGIGFKKNMYMVTVSTASQLLVIGTYELFPV